MNLQVARAEVHVADTQDGELDAKQIVAVMQNVVDDLTADAVEIATAAAATGDTPGVARWSMPLKAWLCAKRLASVRLGLRERLRPHQAVPGMPYQLRPVLLSVL